MKRALFVILAFLLSYEVVWSQSLSWEPVIDDGNVKTCLDCKGDQAVLDIIYPYKDIQITCPYSDFTREWNGYRHRLTFNNFDCPYVSVKHGDKDLTIRLQNDNKLERMTVKTVRINQTPVDEAMILEYFDNRKVTNYLKYSSKGQDGYNWVEIDVVSPIKIELDSDLELKEGRRSVGDNYVFVVRIPNKGRVLNFYSEGFYPITIPIDDVNFQKNCTYEIVVDVPEKKPQTKKYQISANVYDFDITVDGKSYPSLYSNTRVLELPVGWHHCVIKKAGYKSVEFDFESDRNIQLKSDGAEFSIDRPYNVDLWIDNKNYGSQNNIQLGRGTYKCYLDWSNYGDFKQNFTLTMSDQNIHYSTKTMGSLTIKTNAKYYYTYLKWGNNKTRTVYNSNRENNCIGRYYLTVNAPGYKSKNKWIKVKEDQNKIVHCHLFRERYSNFFLGYSASMKAPYGMNIGWMKKTGFILDAKVSKPFFQSFVLMDENLNVNFNEISDISNLTQRKFESATKIGAYTYSMHLGPVYRPISMVPLFVTVGYGQYSSLYEYDSKFYSPATCKGISVELGGGFRLGRILLTCAYTRLLSDPVYADINVGLSICFGKLK